MSNLTRLQAVSSSLDTAITIAENLPEASGGGSGGSVETCTVTLVTDGLSNGDLVHYVDGFSTAQTVNFPSFGQSVAITVVKNSIISATHGSPSGEITILGMYDRNTIFFVYGDAEIMII